jgi:exodeoxyribonuclease VII large subunit
LALKHAEEILLRSSPLRRLGDTQIEFDRLEGEFKRVIQYRFEHFGTEPSKIRKSLEQQLYFIIHKKEQHVEFISKKLEMNNPQLQCKKGWAQVLSQGERITLSELEVNDTFTVEDTSVKIKAVCAEKTSY